jgi:glycosyltransferase involved in cell wall biosynthesis
LYLPSFYDRVPLWGKIGCLYNQILSWFCTLYCRIVTINRIQARVIRSFTGVQTAVVSNLVREVIPAGVNRPGRMVFIGRLDRQKRVDELLLWSDFVGNPFSEFFVIGDGPEREQLELIATQLRHLKVTFSGWLSAEQQDTLMDGNDVLLLNSVIEGEPLVIREARKRGMRVMARNITGIRGVTRRRERFSDCTELQLRLLELSQNRGDEVRGPANSFELSRRESAIRALGLQALGTK